jgi:hypothetical protein
MMEADSGGEGSGEFERVDEVWVSLSPDEMRELRAHIEAWFEDGHADPGWHFHITDEHARGLNIDVMRAEDPRYAPRPPRSQ